MRIHGFWALALILGCSGGAATAPSQGMQTTGVVPSYDDELVAGMSAQGADDASPLAKFSVVRREKAWRPVHVEFASAEACAAFSNPNVHLITRYQKWADFFVVDTPMAKAAIRTAPGFVWMDLGFDAIVPPPVPTGEAPTRASSEMTARGGLSGLKGKGVAIAVIDSGLDFRHPDFITLDAAGKPVSRILAIWDTTSQAFAEKGAGGKAPVTYPGGASLGTVYTKEQLTAELQGGAGAIGSTDANGHGTACAGIAAGNGRGSSKPDFAGVAPEADLIAVRIGGTPTMALENSYLLGAAVEWIDAVAGSRPCVISCSFGGQIGGRDGYRIQERQLDARFPSDRRGRSICIAAGNERDNRIHAGGEMAGGDKPAKLEWKVPEGGRALLSFVFATAQENEDYSFKSVGTAAAPLTGFGVERHPISKALTLTLQPMAPGEYAVEFWTVSGKPAAVDGYLRALASGKEPPVFTGAAAKPEKQVGTPGTASQAITVGSYDYNGLIDIRGKSYDLGRVVGNKPAPFTIGALSDYSNPGPVRGGGVVKPDLVAPGQLHPAAMASNLKPDPNRLVENSGKYVYSNGTSSATPYCAGVIALMYQKRPSLSVGEIKGLLKASLSKDAFTGALPNAGWGHGKLDLKAVRALLGAVK